MTLSHEKTNVRRSNYLKNSIKAIDKIFISQANSGYLNGLAKEMDGSTNKIRTELNHLQQAGYLEKVKQDNKVEYKNIKHPLFDTLKKVVYKHLGLEDLVSTVIERMGNVKKIILIEDYAKGIDSKNIEVVLVGQYLNFEYISQLEEKIEKLIKRKVSFYLASKFLSDKPHIVIFNKDEN